MKSLSIAGLAVIAALISGCAGMDTSKMKYSSELRVNEPQKSKDCYDAAVLLQANAERTKDITTKVLVAIDAVLRTDEPGLIKAERLRHVGVFVGSGGEEIFVNYAAMQANETYVTVATKTGFVGGAGQKAWSCQIVDEMVKMAK
jgi:hypothetical protein